MKEVRSFADLSREEGLAHWAESARQLRAIIQALGDRLDAKTAELAEWILGLDLGGSVDALVSRISPRLVNR